MGTYYRINRSFMDYLTLDESVERAQFMGNTIVLDSNFHRDKVTIKALVEYIEDQFRLFMEDRCQAPIEFAGDFHLDARGDSKVYIYMHVKIDYNVDVCIIRVFFNDYIDSPHCTFYVPYGHMADFTKIYENLLLTVYNLNGFLNTILYS